VSGEASAREVLRNGSARALLLTILMSTTSTIAQAVAIGKLVYDQTGRELDLGLIGLVEFLPVALLVVVSGHVADRFDRRRIVAVGLVADAACALGIAWFASTQPTTLTPYLLLAFGSGVTRAFVAPASRALPPDVVGPLVLPRYVAINSATWQASIIVGPVLAGFLYAANPSAPFVAAAVLASVGAVVVGFVRTPYTAPRLAAGKRASLREALEGLRVIRRTPILLGAISLDLFAVLFGGAVALLPAIAEQRLGVGAVGLGWLRAAAGMGAAIMAVTLAVRPIRRHVGRVLLAAVAVFGFWTIVLGTTRSFAVAFLALMVLSAADAISVFIRATLVPLVTRGESRGRVLAVENVFIGASNELGAFESGVAGQVLGVTGAVVLGGAATIVISAGWWFLFPALRRVDRFRDLVDPADLTVAAAAPRRTTSRSVPGTSAPASPAAPDTPTTGSAG
jgi:MFS family permease